MTTAYTAVCEREDDRWVVTVPELESGGITQAHTLDEVPATVAGLVALMTDADPGSVEVDVRVHSSPAALRAAMAAFWRVIRSMPRVPP